MSRGAEQMFCFARQFCTIVSAKNLKSQYLIADDKTLFSNALGRKSKFSIPVSF